MKIKYYLTVSGRSPVEEFLMEQSFEIRSDVVDALNLLTSGQVLSMPVARPLPNIYPGLSELRLKDRSGLIRIFYYLKKSEAIYMLHAFKKKTRDLPQREIETVLKRLREV